MEAQTSRLEHSFRLGITFRELSLALLSHGYKFIKGSIVEIEGIIFSYTCLPLREGGIAANVSCLGETPYWRHTSVQSVSHHLEHACIYIGSSSHTPLAQGNEVFRPNPRIVEVVIVLIIVGKIGTEDTTQKIN